jgi:polysaccharide biosynthesis/export protein
MGKTESTTNQLTSLRKHLLAAAAIGVLVIAAGSAGIAPGASAQSDADIRKAAAQTGHSEAEVRDRLRATRMSAEEIRAALREAGYDPDAVKAIRVEGSSPFDTTRFLPPSGALTESLFTAPPGSAAVPLSQRPQDWPPFTREIATRLPGALAPVLPFGYEIFSYAPTTFEPLSAGPVDPDYPLGPGDEVIIQVWGDNQYTHAATVTREGTITVPDIGQVVLNGMSLAQAKRLITLRLATVYSGIRGSRPTAFVDVTLGKLHAIQVFILGDVVRPGGYTISSVSTVLNALYNSGGPTPRGSMRDVRIMRHNSVYRSVDLYRYILAGSKADDVRLQSGDVVFVPPVGKVAAVLGEVHRPAIYELKAGDRFRDLLELAGGIQSTADLRRAQIDRVIPFAERAQYPDADRRAIDLALSTVLADGAPSPELVDRDIVQIFRVGDVLKNTISISGATVVRPGTFQLREGMKVSDLVREAGGFYRDVYLDRAYLVRTHADLTRSIHAFNLGKAVTGVPEDDLVLAERDSVAVASMWDIAERHTVTVSGSVRKPGTYEYLNGMTVMDLIFRAGGLRESASPLEAEVSRVDSTTIATLKAARIFRIPISANYRLASADTTFPLQKWDQVFVREIPDWQMQRNVTVNGEVVYPGTYSLSATNERLSSVIRRAGGLKSDAYPRAATFVRKKDGAGRLAVRVDEAVKGRKRWDLTLEEGDVITIPREPRTVKVVGEVGFPASVLYDGGKSLGWYVDQAGGYTDKADKSRVKLIQPGGRVVAPRRFWPDPSPHAGALLIVPVKPADEKHDTLKDVATIMSILTGAVTTIFLAHEATK